MSKEEACDQLLADAGLPAWLEPRRRGGGRPPKAARDIAVFLARQWRFEQLGTYAQADAWVLEQWKHHGLSAPKHVRDRCEAARAGLRKSFGLGPGAPLRFIEFFQGRLAAAVECDPNGPRLLTLDGIAVPAGAKRGGSAWMWVEGMLEAVEARVSTAPEAPDLRLTPIAEFLRRS